MRNKLDAVPRLGIKYSHYITIRENIFGLCTTFRLRNFSRIQHRFHFQFGTIHTNRIPANSAPFPRRCLRCMASEEPEIRDSAAGSAQGSRADAERGDTWVSHPSRDRALGMLLQQVDLMSLGKLQGTGHCFVVVGPRGTGKSAMLRRLKSHTPKSVVVATEANLEQHETLVAVVQALFADVEGLNEHLGPAELVDRLNAELCVRERGLLLLLDECENLFTEEFSEVAHKSNMRFLRAVANLQGQRRITYVLSGSSPRLRPLLFAKLQKRDCPGSYVRYNAAYDLNSGKTVPLLVETREWTKDGFCSAVRSLMGNPGLALSDEHASLLYISLGGQLRELETAITKCDTVNALLVMARDEAVRSIRDPAHGLLPSVRVVVERMVKKRHLRSGNLAEWMRDPFSFQRDRDGWIHDSDVLGEPIPGADRVLSKADLYNMSDDGFLFYDDDSLRVLTPCVHALLRFEALRANETISAIAQLALTYPFSTLGTDAETILGACLNERKGEPVPERHAELPKWDYRNSTTSDELHQFLAGHGTAVLKEHPDRQGADLVLLEKGVDATGNECVCMTRIQVKLTSPRSNSDKWDASKVADVDSKFANPPVTVDGVRVPRVLATTHALTEGARKKCEEKDIEIWDRNYLAESVWSEAIVKWGRENQYEEYAPSHR